MNILILGSGGREHSLAWAVMQNPKCDKLIVAPGNAGIAQIADCASFDIEDGGEVVNFVATNAIDFVIVGPEAPLASGVADRLREAGVLVLAPPKPPHGWKRPRASQKKSATPPMPRLLGMATSPMPKQPRPISAKKVRQSW